MTREEAISIMNVIVHMLEPQYDTDRIEDAVEMAIKALEQELKTGHWIFDKKSDLSKCSICGAYCPHDGLGRIETYYCSYCGAKMQTESEDKK